MDKIRIELSYDELDALVELVGVGNNIMNGYKVGDKQIKKYNDIVDIIGEIYKNEIIKNSPEMEEELEIPRNYIFDRTYPLVEEFEEELIYHKLASKLLNLRWKDQDLATKLKEILK